MSRLTVAIPAKDEEASICVALRALAEQQSVAGGPLPAGTFDVIVVANDCRDATARVARELAHTLPFALHVYERSLPPEAAHVGSARRIALDLACEAQARYGTGLGVIASTDADTIVDRFWVAQTLNEIEEADVVAGFVEVAPDDCDRMLAPQRLLYDRERAYRRAYAEMESRLDPRPCDPVPRHDSLVGSTFAVRTTTYEAAGRLPVIAVLEDVAFARALERIDARVRHSLRVRCTTSPRVDARVVGGFATFLADLGRLGSDRKSLFVEAAARSIARARNRQALRAVWTDGGDERALIRAAALYEIDARTLASCVVRSEPFGITAERVESLWRGAASLPDEPVEVATAALRAMTSGASAASATRSKAASGAG